MFGEIAPNNQYEQSGQRVRRLLSLVLGPSHTLRVEYLIRFVTCPRIDQACSAWKGGSGRCLRRSPSITDTNKAADGCKYFCCWPQEASDACRV